MEKALADNYNYIIIIKIFHVHPCTGGHRKSLDPKPKPAASLGQWLLEATERMTLCTLPKALEMGKTTSEFNVLDKNVRYEWTLTLHGVQMAREPDSR